VSSASRRLRVLITTSTFPVHPDDGTPRFIYDLAHSIADFADVTVLAPDSPGASKVERSGALDIRRFSYFCPRRLQRLALGAGMRDNLRNSWLARLQVPGFMVAQVRATGALIREKAIEVVNAHWLAPQGLTSAWVCRGANRLPLILHVHAGDVYLLRRLRIGRTVARYITRRADAVMADGSHVRDTLDELLRYPSKAILRPMGVHLARFSQAGAPAIAAGGAPPGIDEFPDGYVLFFGRMVEKKGAVYLVRAFPRVLEMHPSLGLVLVGDGPERPKLEQEVRRLGIGGSVRFVGRRNHSEIARYLHRCRVAVVPSIIDRYGETEGMPTVVLEALAAGVRVVASAVDGIPDVLRDGRNGWLCRDKDPADLAEKLLRALADPATSAVAAEALESAGKHDWSRVGTEYIQHLRAAVERRSRSVDR
jgi:glycosyltransferase involved in cell wall biosynthesis